MPIPDDARGRLPRNAVSVSSAATLRRQLDLLEQPLDASGGAHVDDRPPIPSRSPATFFTASASTSALRGIYLLNGKPAGQTLFAPISVPSRFPLLPSAPAVPVLHHSHVALGDPETPQL